MCRPLPLLRPQEAMEEGILGKEEEKGRGRKSFCIKGGGDGEKESVHGGSVDDRSSGQEKGRVTLLVTKIAIKGEIALPVLRRVCLTTRGAPKDELKELIGVGQPDVRGPENDPD